MTGLLLWWPVLFLQGATFTWSSRAKNSGSIGYAAVVTTLSHVLWFAVQVFIVTSIFDAASDKLVATGAVYVSAMTSGGAFAMWASRRWAESGSRRVGA